MLNQRDGNTYNIVPFGFKYNIDCAEYKGDALVYLFHHAKQIDERAWIFTVKSTSARNFWATSVIHVAWIMELADMISIVGANA